MNANWKMKHTVTFPSRTLRTATTSEEGQNGNYGYRKWNFWLFVAKKTKTSCKDLGGNVGGMKKLVQHDWSGEGDKGQRVRTLVVSDGSMVGSGLLFIPPRDSLMDE